MEDQQQENVLNTFRLVRVISILFGIPPLQLYKSKYYRFYLIALFILLIECIINFIETYVWQLVSRDLGFFNYFTMLTRRVVVIYSRIKTLRDYDFNNRIFLNLHEVDKQLASIGYSLTQE